MSVLTRLDITEAVTRPCRYLHAPTTSQLKNAICVLQYLKGSIEFGITFRKHPGNLTISGYGDANFTIPTNSNGKYVIGYVHNLGSGALSYSSKLQNTVARSTAEAEYVALGMATAEAIYFRILIGELGHPPIGLTFIGEDHEDCLTIATTTQTSHRTRHICIEFHFIRDAINVHPPRICPWRGQSCRHEFMATPPTPHARRQFMCT